MQQEIPVHFIRLLSVSNRTVFLPSHISVYFFFLFFQRFIFSALPQAVLSRSLRQLRLYEPDRFESLEPILWAPSDPVLEERYATGRIDERGEVRCVSSRRRRHSWTLRDIATATPVIPVLLLWVPDRFPDKPYGVRLPGGSCGWFRGRLRWGK